MSGLSEQQKAFANKRRDKTEHFFKDPWHRRVARLFETFGKKVSLRLLGKVLRIKPVSGYLPFDKINSVLFLRTDGIGDAIVTTPLWRALKSRRPDLKIGVAGSYRNIPLLEHDVNVDHLYNFTETDPKKRKQEIDRARAMHYDLVIGCTFHRTTRTAIQARQASTHGYTAYMLRGKPDNRVHLFSKIVFREGIAEMPMILKLQYMLEQVLGIELADSERMPKLYIPKDAIDTVNKGIVDLFSVPDAPLVVINTEAATPYREWGFDNSYTLAEHLVAARPDMNVAFTTSPHRAEELIAYLSQKTMPTNIRYVPTGSIFEIAALIRRSALVISPDTSIIHIANAEQKPIVGFYIKETEWKPYQVPAYVFIAKQSDPISSIPVDSVLGAVNDLLEPTGDTLREQTLHTIVLH